MQRGKYQLFRHKRIASMQKNKSKKPESPENIPNVKSSYYASTITAKNNNLVDEIETVQSYTPDVSCKSGCVFDLKSSQFIWKSASSEKRQIASLTKIMTCLITIQYIKQNKIIPEDQIFVVSKKAADIGGTSAELEEGDKVSLWDLLHGLMLPSGNDAALCIAENIGENFQHIRKNPIDSFVDQMNKRASEYKMVNTNYANPHGLSHRNHKSTCQDQILLIKQALKDNVFNILIQKKIFFSNVQQKSGWSRQLFWQSTNKLLFHGFKGIKTGSTPQAGPCLASWYNTDGYNLIIITLCSSNNDQRFKDAMNIVKWIKSKSNTLDLQN